VRPACVRRSTWGPSRNCQTDWRSRGSVKPVSSAGDGAKRSGLTEPRTAGQSRVVMAAVQATVANVSELARRSRRAGGRKAGGGERRPPQSRIQSECALNLQNAVSGQILTAVEIGTVRLNRTALPSAHDTGDALFRRTSETCKRGVSDPLWTGRGAKKGAAKWGSLTPHLPHCTIATATQAATRPAQSAALDVRRSARPPTTLALAGVRSTATSKRPLRTRPAFSQGNGAPEFPFPHPVPPRPLPTKDGSQGGRI
jgi:hypothetical protein